jgi:single-stranded DNA-binding protein
MYKYKNKVQLIGKVFNIELIIQDDGFKFAKFRITTNESYLSFDGKKRMDKMYHLCFAFGKHYEILERFLKDDAEVAIEGSLINNSLLVEHTEVIETGIHISDLLMLGKHK